MAKSNEYITIPIKTSKRLSNFVDKFNKTYLPLWLVSVLLINTVLATGFLEYYVMKKQFNKTLIELAQSTKSPEELVKILKQEVLPQKGYTLGVRWNDIGKKLIETGIIDKEKYDALFANEPQAKQYMKHLTNVSNEYMVINEQSSRFMVNTLWALGLVNKSKILEEGSMKTVGDGNHMNYASTGGWDQGIKPTSELYSSSEVIKLTPKQEDLVKKIAQNIYRPCCNNHTEFPDCNHGMAALGYIQLAVNQGLSEERIYKDLLALNSFWFPQNYIEIAAYMNKKNEQWKNADPKTILSYEYSSGQGAARVKQSIQGLPGVGGGGGCSA